MEQSATEARNHLQDELIRTYDNYLKVLRDGGLSLTIVESGSDRWKKWKDALEGVAQKDRDRYPAQLIKLLDQGR